MRIACALVSVGAVASLLAGTGLPSSSAVSAAAAVQSPALALAPGVTAFYEMDEAPGTTVMHDSGPHGLDAPVDPTGVGSGVGFDGATGYFWTHRAPEAPPPSPERIIQIPDNPNLEPGNGPFTIELRYRTKENFGNITQKGQAQSQGGQWKIQAPQGIPSCLFDGSAGQVATGAKTPLNDEQWHNVTCALTSTGVTMYVDGEQRNRKNGSTGTIDNGIPMTVGGKINCNQVTITCDYFSGQIDYIKITKAANLAPTAAFTRTCHGLACAFDSSGAADADGSLTRYAWDFGDGQTSTAANPSHTYAVPGTYNVRLTVTDNQAVTDNETVPVNVEEAPPIESPIAFVASASSAANNSTPRVTVPASAAPGDRLVLVLSYNNLARTVSAPTGVTGWHQLDSIAADSMGTVAWTKVVQAGDPGTAVTVPLSGNAKYTLTVADYTETEATPSIAFASATDLSTASSRRTPTVTRGRGGLGGLVLGRQVRHHDGLDTCGLRHPATGRLRGGRRADLQRARGLRVRAAAGAVRQHRGDDDRGLRRSGDVVVRAAPLDGRPAAQPAAHRRLRLRVHPVRLRVRLVRLRSTWTAPSRRTRGTSATATARPTPTPRTRSRHAGSYDVALTVTDDDGDSDSMTATVDVQGEPVESQVAFGGSAAAQANNATPRVTVPATAAVGDRLLLALSLNNTARTFTAPTGVSGWTQLDSVVADDMRTVFWTKVVQAGRPRNPGDGHAQRHREVHRHGRRLHRRRPDDRAGVRPRDRHEQPREPPDPGHHDTGGRLGRLVLGRQVQHDDDLDCRSLGREPSDALRRRCRPDLQPVRRLRPRRGGRALPGDHRRHERPVEQGDHLDDRAAAGSVTRPPGRCRTDQRVARRLTGRNCPRRHTPRHTRARCPGASSRRPSSAEDRKASAMALFMDAHTIEGGVAASDVAAAHQADLATQDAYGVSYGQYWVDEAAGKIFCLVDAPDAEAAATVHREAHGLVADEIYAVTQGA